MTAPVLEFDHPDLESNAGGVRLSMKADDQPRGHFDGVWWPHSTEPLGEFADLIHAVGNRVTGRITRVSFDMNAWSALPPGQRLIIDGNKIRLEGFRTGPAHTLTVSNQDRARLQLLVVPPEASGDKARRIARAALVEHPESTARDLVTMSEEPIGATQSVNSERSSR